MEEDIRKYDKKAYRKPKIKWKKPQTFLRMII
jgi:hypothetical protein